MRSKSSPYFSFAILLNLSYRLSLPHSWLFFPKFGSPPTALTDLYSPYIAPRLASRPSRFCASTVTSFLPLYLLLVLPRLLAGLVSFYFHVVAIICSLYVLYRHTIVAYPFTTTGFSPTFFIFADSTPSLLIFVQGLFHFHISLGGGSFTTQTSLYLVCLILVHNALPYSRRPLPLFRSSPLPSTPLVPHQLSLPPQPLRPVCSLLAVFYCANLITRV